MSTCTVKAMTTLTLLDIPMLTATNTPTEPAAMAGEGEPSGDLALLDVATGDMLHQPARQTIFPAMKNMFRAAMAVGALGVFLSGAGSTVLALAQEKEFTIGYEMADAAAKSGIEGQVKITKPVSQGTHVVHSV